MNWILLSSQPLSSDPDNPQKLECAPVSQRHYNKVEKQNSIRINVFGYEDGQPFPINISKETFEDQMNLLLITKDEKKHYVLIKDFNAFMYNQSKHKER